MLEHERPANTTPDRDYVNLPGIARFRRAPNEIRALTWVEQRVGGPFSL